MSADGHSMFVRNGEILNLMSKFKITRASGFQMTFENGWTISVQFGAGNYCDNYSRDYIATGDIDSTNAEIAVWDADGNWYSFEDDQVMGYCSTNEVLSYMIKFALLPASTSGQ